QYGRGHRQTLWECQVEQDGATADPGAEHGAGPADHGGRGGATAVPYLRAPGDQRTERDQQDPEAEAQEAQTVREDADDPAGSQGVGRGGEQMCSRGHAASRAVRCGGLCARGCGRFGAHLVLLGVASTVRPESSSRCAGRMLGPWRRDGRTPPATTGRAAPSRPSRNRSRCPRRTAPPPPPTTLRGRRRSPGAAPPFPPGRSSRSSCCSRRRWWPPSRWSSAASSGSPPEAPTAAPSTEEATPSAAPTTSSPERRPGTVTDSAGREVEDGTGGYDDPATIGEHTVSWTAWTDGTIAVTALDVDLDATVPGAG